MITVVDLVKAADFWNEPQGIVKIYGRCVNPDEDKDLQSSDYAYRLTDGYDQLSISTETLFTEFPQNFSILLLVRPQPGKNIHLLLLK